MPAAEPPGGEGGSGTPGLLSFKSRPGKCQDQPRARTAEQENVLKHTFLGSPPPRHSSPLGMGSNKRICISNELPDDAEAPSTPTLGGAGALTVCVVSRERNSERRRAKVSGHTTSPGPIRAENSGPPVPLSPGSLCIHSADTY